ncbi:P-loop NTPase fold protein [Paraglaciecola sp. 2405UD69-4]|uniref:KAP family P-loop NTPase fold protein n=1 Tax=Paraglaciecola sp. 2405UD69-4 TaxID=3391836 RepID=UPI0039C90435
MKESDNFTRLIQVKTLPEGQLEDILFKLYDKDPLFPALLAARAALRQLPLAGHKERLGYLETDRDAPINNDANTQSGDYPDNRASFLLAISFIIQKVISLSLSNPSSRKFEQIQAAINRLEALVKEANARFNETNGKTGHSWHGEYDNFFKNAAYKSVYIAAAATANAALLCTDSNAKDGCIEQAIKGINAVDEYSKAAANYHVTSEDVIAAGADLKQNFGPDLEQAQQGLSIGKLAGLPLWKYTAHSPVLTIYKNMFIPAVERLIREVQRSSQTSADALNKTLVGIKNSQEEYVASAVLAAESDVQLLDKLGRENLVNGLRDLLTHKENNEHLTVGLLGHWGAGKTRVCELLKQAIQEKQDKSCGFLFGEFNAWAYEHSENPQAAMAHEVIKSLTTCSYTVDVSEGEGWLLRICTPFKNLLAVALWKLTVRTRLSLGFMIAKYPWRLIMLVAWPTLALVLVNYSLSSGLSKDTLLSSQGVTGLGAIITALFAIWRIPKELKVLLAQPYTKELLSYLKLPDYAKHIGQISEMRNDIELMVNIRLGTEQGNNQYGLGKILPRRRLLFVVDDLDRCSPAGIVKTFEAIRLVLDLPQVIVVVAVDQRIALAALALHYEKLRVHHQLNDAKSIARDYLAKMIQLPIVVNDADSNTLKGYMSHLWKDPEDKPGSPPWLDWLANKDSTEILNDQKQSKDPGKSEKTVEQGATEQELAKWVSDLPKPQLNIANKQNFGLSDRQKAAFAYWHEKFALGNARQVKRLYNSYNLMRLVSNQEDTPIDMDQEKFCYGLLVTLLVTEYINGIEDNPLRFSLGQCLKNKDAGSEEKLTNIDASQLSAFRHAISIIDASAKQRFESLPIEKRYSAMLEFVDLFVLPAIDEAAQKNKS